MEAQQQQQQKQQQQQQQRQQQQQADVKSVAVWSSKSTAPSRLPDLVTDSDSGADDGPCDAESSSDE